MTTLYTIVASAVPQITSPPRFELHKRAGECGDLQGQYPNAVVPTCAGSFSKCTFSAGQQGCCDGSNNCQFFTSCNGGLASGSARCTAGACLQCQPDKPYCTQYKFTEGLRAYTGFACGGISIPADITVQGIVATGQPITISSGASSASITTSKASNSTSQTSRMSTMSSMISSSISPANSISTGDTQPSSGTGIHLSTGVIAGIAVGGFVLLAVVSGLIWTFCCGTSPKRKERPMLEPI